MLPILFDYLIRIKLQNDYLRQQCPHYQAAAMGTSWRAVLPGQPGGGGRRRLKTMHIP